MKWCRTDTSANKDSNLHIENILSWSAVRTINPHDGKRSGDAGRVKLDEISTRSSEIDVFLILFSATHCGLCKSSNNGWPSADTLPEGLSPIADLTDVDRNIWVFWGRSDSELDIYEPLHHHRGETTILTGCHCQRETSGTWRNNH